MASINDDLARQVVPRWRTFAATTRFGELRSLKARPAGDFHAGMLKPLLEDWQREPSFSVAADLVSAAFVTGQTSHVSDAANFILQQPNATLDARRLATKCLGTAAVSSESEVSVTHDFGGTCPPGIDELRAAIRGTRQRLHSYPFNPVLWADLAFFYTTLGQYAKAEQAIRVALNLAPNNRFIVRAGCRFYLHHGDISRAHEVLLNTLSLRFDPWLLASEIAVASIRHRASALVRRSRQIIESQDFSPFHLSELCGELATLEASGGNLRKARRLCEQSLLEPTENAVAQASWLGRQLGVNISKVPDSKSSEATAWGARLEGHWETALKKSKEWQSDQPFSSRPASFGSYVASTGLEEFQQAEKMLRLGLLSNEDATLYNNLAFALAQQDKVVEAEEMLNRGMKLNRNPMQTVCLTATRGLIEYRSGRVTQGAIAYATAIAAAHGRDELKDLGETAKFYRALEEIRAGTSTAAMFRKEAKEAVERLPASLQSVLAPRLDIISSRAGSSVRGPAIGSR